MIARLLAAVGFPASAVGLTVYGMATSMSQKDETLANQSLALMIGGFIVGMIGIAIYRAQESRSTPRSDDYSS